MNFFEKIFAIIGFIALCMMVVKSIAGMNDQFYDDNVRYAQDEQYIAPVDSIIIELRELEKKHETL